MAKKPKKKINKYNVYLGTFALVTILMLVIYYSNFIQITKEPERYEEIQRPTTKLEEFIGGFCKRNSECFITYCKGNEEDCVNTTQLSDYSKNCKTYSDWVIGRQDSSKCSCIQNVCKIIK